MDYQVFFILSIIVLVILAIYTYSLFKERDKYLLAYKPIQRERDNLKEELDRLKALNTSAKANDNADKSSKADNADKSCKSDNDCDSETADLREKIKSLKADLAKLKEENFSIRKDNKSMRMQLKDHADNNDSGQRELADLRSLNDDLENELKIAKQQIASLEKRVSDTAAEKTAESTEKTAQDEAALDRLQKDNASLAASLKDVRSELASYKRDFKSQLDAAKKSLADANQPIKKDLARANKLSEQAKKRASNNHKIYLIARAQVVLLEKKLQTLDPSYVPEIMFAVTNEAIDEMVKKIDTADARASKASSDVAEKQKTIDALRQELANLSEAYKALSDKNKTLTEKIESTNSNDVAEAQKTAQNADQETIDALRQELANLSEVNKALSDKNQSLSKTVEELKAADDENKARLVALTETPKAEPRDISFGSLDDLNISDDSFTSLIANVGEKGVSESKSLVDLDFGDMDDDWA